MIALPAAARASAPRALLLLLGLALAVGLRVAVNGPGVPAAFIAGALFGVLLLGVSLTAGWRPGRPRAASMALGLAGGVVLVVVPWLVHPLPAPGLGLHPQPFGLWVAITVLVAVGEEVLLRGVLFNAINLALGLPAAVAVSSLAFALLHVPLYGWQVVPLDLGVGVLFAGLRILGRGAGAPALAHLIADLATWWL
ncbi:MAG: CPBP family intramembrane glutamic endopeptidase [Candidatus Limnocylindrales bacterium]